ncbi:hypothetical protein ACYCS5_25230 [Paenibacillus sp. SEL3]|uniref:Uncharacterized protein n=1 Tax=Paenibacillus polymyxa TaxID=1406 RepID=A0A8I1IUQ7_PAEPO|nr:MULTISPECIES: hypothetical protein [unclassified Paenibacillus]KAF6574232.1 hypothetical protein G9G53_10520 [Paenibacillus sp. EKM206P]KAF6588703.1 hypothetical protein G9G52_11445 [Paenibacillus sp. EKM205P]MBM0632900.1 hypothetical protein [Paenibacillus polymyxa]
MARPWTFHVVNLYHGKSNEEHAAQHGNHVQTSLTDDESGYPVVEGQGDVYYAYEDKTYIKGNKGDGQLIPTPPVLKQIAAELL